VKNLASIALLAILLFSAFSIFQTQMAKAETVYKSNPSVIASNTAFYTSNHWASQNRNYYLNGYWYTFYTNGAPGPVREWYGYSSDGVNWNTAIPSGINTPGSLNFAVMLSGGNLHFVYGNLTGLYYGTLTQNGDGSLSSTNESLIYSGGGHNFNVYPDDYCNVFVDNQGNPWVTFCQTTGTVGNYTEAVYIDHSNATANNNWVAANGIYPYQIANTTLDTLNTEDPLGSLVSYSDNSVQFVFALSYADNMTSYLFNATSLISHFNTSLASNGFETEGYPIQHNLIKTSANRVFWISACVFTNGTAFQGLIEMNKTAIVKVTSVFQYWGAFQLAITPLNEIAIQGSTLNAVQPENITMEFYNLTSNTLSSQYLVVPNALNDTKDPTFQAPYGSEWNEGVQLSKNSDPNGTYLMTYINYPDQKLYSVLINFNSNIAFPTPTTSAGSSTISSIGNSGLTVIAMLAIIPTISIGVLIVGLVLAFRGGAEINFTKVVAVIALVVAIDAILMVAVLILNDFQNMITPHFISVSLNKIFWRLTS